MTGRDMLRFRRVASTVMTALCILLMTGCLLTAVMAACDARNRGQTYASKGVQAVAVERIERPQGGVDVNHGSAEQLTALPNIGPVRAQAIIDEREARGPFHYPEDLMDVKGIGEKRLAAMRDMLWFDMEE